MELRDIEIFLTLADELHFGRTAARLRVTPARISQSIKQQERRIGTAYCPFYTPSGRPVANCMLVTDLEDIFTSVSSGEIVLPLGAQSPRYFARPDICYLPIHDAPRLRWGLIWRVDTDNPLIYALAQVVRDLGTLNEP